MHIYIYSPVNEINDRIDKSPRETSYPFEHLKAQWEGSRPYNICNIQLPWNWTIHNFANIDHDSVGYSVYGTFLQQPKPTQIFTFQLKKYCHYVIINVSQLIENYMKKI